MNNQDLLLEIGIEEMPARFILDAIENLEKKMLTWLEGKRIEHGDIKVFSTPRRLAVLVQDVAVSQKDVEEEAKGPAKKVALDQEGEWSKAAIGFSRSQGVSAEEIFFKELKGVEYAYVKKFTKGEDTIALLPELADMIKTLHFPNSMRWGNKDLRFLRPIRWIVALFGHEIIPFSVANIQASAKTDGHRFLGEEIEISEPIDYEKLLQNQYVIVDYQKRMQMIKDQIEDLSNNKKWVIPEDDELMSEVTNLVEYPTVFAGTFNEEFLHLPEEVLITSMKAHQRYFPVKDDTGALLPNFIGVRNGNEYHLETVTRGNEKVLKARLADADFFYKEDQKMQIEQVLPKLEAIIYHEKIGTLAEKVKRIRKIAAELAIMIDMPDELRQQTDRAAEISKFDLVTNMVNEFPELQGIMGEKYALQQGEHPEVAKAVNEHYQPRHADDAVPTATIGSLVSIADKLDSIVTSFAIGLIPTGSQDPYALRRQATGIIHILLEKDWNVSLTDLLKKAITIASNSLEVKEDLFQQLRQFIKLRLKFMLQAEGIRHDIVESVLEGEFNSVPDIVGRAKALETMKSDETFKETIESFSRVLNIASKGREGIIVDTSLFENEYEETLYQKWQTLQETSVSKLKPAERLEALASLQPAISAYFDHTMVMAEHEKLKENRLSQMTHLAKLIGAYAAMNEIQVK
ncbi:glycine--tRNA ligase subunit beta [Lederbergia lenta]|uniref:glycine--tRNA ligase subunit beta n=1 Tax=Lederbergia lenta TaxID=1467 RepID=UPI00203C9606|nr:glycine--tRNA ligase subunit beta [Lederbergia lenta]MCM3111389.1 glycine--tRNA ligase subunit beta [Lederbergia lenta]